MKPLLLAVALLGASAAQAAPSLRTDKTSYAPGESITLHFDTGGAAVQANGWIGIVPAAIAHGSEATNDAHDLTYQYLSGKASGTLTFAAPGQPGRYDFRMHDTDNNGKELAASGFEVVAPAYEGALKLERLSYAPGEAIEVSFTASDGLPGNAWVGIIPSRIEHGSEPKNDEYDVQYKYLEGKSKGVLSFVAPATPGAWDLRLNSTDSGGVELASVSFEVEGGLSADAMARTLKDRGKLAVYGIRFATGQATIDPASADVLASIGKMLSADPALRLRIEGHTDNVGQPAANMDLSRRRAESVKNHLVSKIGVDAGRLTTRGLGDTSPLGRNDNEDGRAQNRRVELVAE